VANIAISLPTCQHSFERAGMAVVACQAFGLREATGWCRLSVGAVSLADIEAMLPRLRAALVG
jgi:aspartate aminotransferase